MNLPCQRVVAKIEWHAGTEYAGEGLPSPGDEFIFCRFSGRIQPAVVGPNKQPIAPDVRPEAGGVYNGCYGRVSYNVYTYNKVNNGVGLGLLNFQKTGDGELFGFGGSDPDEDFDVVEGSTAGDNEVSDIL